MSPVPVDLLHELVTTGSHSYVTVVLDVTEDGTNLLRGPG